MLSIVLIHASIIYLILLVCPGAVSFRRNVATPSRTTSWLYTTIRSASDIDLPVVARFLSETMYGAAVPNGQRNELSRLQLIELRDGFGSHVGRSMYPSVLLIAEDNQEIIGCVGLDCQVLDSGARKLSKHTTASKYSTAYNALSSSISISSSISTSTSTSTSTNTHSGAQNTNRSSSTNAMHVTSTITARRNTDKVSSYSTKSTANAVAAKDTTAIASNEHKNTVLVQSNLAVRSGMRQQGVASELLSTCEECAKDWGFEFLYLMVKAENAAAQQLFQKHGYKEVFRDRSATCVLPGTVGLSTVQCVNLCYRKSVLYPAKNRLGIADKLGGMFRNVFK